MDRLTERVGGPKSVAENREGFGEPEWARATEGVLENGQRSDYWDGRVDRGRPGKLETAGRPGYRKRRGKLTGLVGRRELGVRKASRKTRRGWLADRQKAP